MSAQTVELDIDDERSREELHAALRQLLREGRTRMDELADSLGLSAVDTERLVRVAEQAGDVTRDGYTGRGLYTIRLTEQGSEKLPPLSERASTLAEHRLNELDYDVLRAVAEADRCTAATIRERIHADVEPVELIPVVTHLVREGYLDESGLLRRYVELTDEGGAVLDSLENTLTSEPEVDDR